MPTINKWVLICLVASWISSYSHTVRGDGDPLVITARVETKEITEAAPFVVNVKMRNPSPSEIELTRDVDDAEALSAATILSLKFSDGRIYSIGYTGKPQAMVYVPPVRKAVPPGWVVEFDRVFVPIHWGEINGGRGYGYSYLPPGDYIGDIRVALGAGALVVSDPFPLRIVPAVGEDRIAREKVGVEIAPFLCGGEPPSRADGARRSVLAQIRSEYPKSQYAQWLRFWDVYYGGPIEDMSHYVRDNQSFPLADNLMLHMAEGLFEAGRYREAREVLRELRERFPDGDTRQAALQLVEKLTMKR